MKKQNILFLALISLFVSACVNLEPDPDMSQSFVLGQVVGGESLADSKSVPIYVMRPQLPSYLDSNRIQYLDASGLVSFLEDAYWAESLADGVARAFAQYATGEGALDHPSYYPWPEPGDDVSKLILKFRRFDATALGEVHVVANWTLRLASGERVSGLFEAVDLTWDTGVPSSLVAAYNEALRLLAERIASSL